MIFIFSTGLTTFKGSFSENRYLAETFNFHLCPVPLGACDPRFSLQASSIRFMVKHNFDFNKWLYEGIPFLNNVQEKQIKSDLESGLPFNGIDGDVDEKKLQELCSFVAMWLPSSSVGDSVVVPVEKDEPVTAMYIYQADLRKRFTQIWTSLDPFGQLVVKRVEPEEREILELNFKGSEKEQQERQVLEMLGFTRVFRLMTGLTTPIIGHNLLMDLIFMYEKFHQPLPEFYSQFKQDIHRLFPNIFDTKHIGHSLRNRLEHLKLHAARNLQDLYDILHSPSVMNLTLMQPSVEKADWSGMQEQIHQAGYDAFLCGCSFLRICHLLHFRNTNSMSVKACPFQAYLVTVRNFCNCVNVIRAMVNHVKLDGEEPPSQRPPLIHVEVVQPGDKILPQQLVGWFSMYGTVDIQMINEKQAIVATSNFMTARDIIYQFKGHKFIKVSKYKFWEHSPLGQKVFIGSLVLATGSCLLLLMNALK
ncbi:poly(A)-specific ribonuclease PARN-like domain-containing protein 1 [Elysia marginata]|uniref:Poly(A)-specific ribonuclease PARN-like domain-containing protein 1 n=1 Tax=Elysia marginata TaxID=1093978 RepID=A0AAV4IXP5_9GAST|nr:poly(A)-specific ribonuclease PARN-like domain-containing protein 1 [Elysia marginata]